MRFKKNDNTYFTIAFQEYDPLISINYELIEISGNKYRSIDRGEDTDRYATKITTYGKRAYIDSLITELQLLRDNNKPIIIDECQEGIFGDHVYYGSPISCVLFEFGEQSSKSFNTFQIDITLLSTGISYNAGGSIPTSMKCLSHGWKGGANMNIHTNETYNSNNYFVNRVADSFEFEGSYILTTDDNADLFNYWRIQRGNVFTIDEADFGVTKMFGTLGGTGSHDVIIQEIITEPISSIYRSTTIKLIKVS
jgi:hypothetical protein